MTKTKPHPISFWHPLPGTVEIIVRPHKTTRIYHYSATLGAMIPVRPGKGYLKQLRARYPDLP